MAKITEHFTYEEVVFSQTASRYDIDNTPSEQELEKCTIFAQRILEPVRAHFGKHISPSSWFRSQALNEAIGGSESSQHCKGEACDFEVSGVSNKDVVKWIYDHLSFDQIILEFHDEKDPNSGWIHCSYRQGHNRMQCLRSYRDKNSRVHYVVLDLSNHIVESRNDEDEDSASISKDSNDEYLAKDNIFVRIINAIVALFNK